MTFMMSNATAPEAVLDGRRRLTRKHRQSPAPAVAQAFRGTDCLQCCVHWLS